MDSVMLPELSMTKMMSTGAIFSVAVASCFAHAVFSSRPPPLPPLPVVPMSRPPVPLNVVVPPPLVDDSALFPSEPHAAANARGRATVAQSRIEVWVRIGGRREGALRKVLPEGTTNGPYADAGTPTQSRASGASVTATRP